MMKKYKLEDIKNPDKILFKIEKTDSCWIWKGQLDKRLPYGVYANKKAHRLVWMITNQQDWPIGKIARHICHNHSCVNPDHLIPGTHKENWQDSKEKYLKHLGKRTKEQETKRIKKIQKAISTPFGNFNSIKEAVATKNVSHGTIFNKLKIPGSGYTYIKDIKWN